MEAKNFEEVMDALDEKVETNSPTVLEEKEEETSLALREAFEASVSTLAPSALELTILEGVLSNKSIPQLSVSIGIQESYIRNYLRKKDVKEYLKEIRETVNDIHQSMIQTTLANILAARIEEVEIDHDGNYSKLTKKDTLEVIKTFSDITSKIAAGQKVDQEQDVFVKIYNQVMT